MNPDDVCVLAVVAVLVLAAWIYIRKSMKAGIRCVGCPDSGRCSGNCSVAAPVMTPANAATSAPSTVCSECCASCSGCSRNRSSKTRS